MIAKSLENKSNSDIVLSFFLLIFSSLFIWTNYNTIALIVLITGILFLIKYVVDRTSGYNSFTAIFLLFSIPYTLSAIITKSLNLEFNFFNVSSAYDQYFLTQVNMMYLGLLFGFLFTSYLPIRHSIFIAKDNDNSKSTIDFYSLGLNLTIISSIMEMINVYRSGGFSILFSGKAIYQEASGDLFLTLPSKYVLDLALVFIGLGIHKNISKMKIFKFVISLMPMIAITGILGQRGPILGWVMIFIVSTTFNKKIRNLNKKMLFMGLFLYVVMGLLYNYRAAIGIYMSTGNVKLIEKYSDNTRIFNYLNPANNEFGAAYGNYIMFLEKDKGNLQYKLGSSFFVGLAVPIPSFIYLVEKPKQIVYEFRDEYFAGLSKKSRIAGTGFSGLLEAYINFGNFGSLIFYAILGVILMSIEKIRLMENYNYLYVFLYCIIIPVSQSYHRSSFGGLFGEITLKIVLIIFVFIVFNKLNIIKKTFPHD